VEEFDAYLGCAAALESTQLACDPTSGIASINFEAENPPCIPEFGAFAECFNAGTGGG
jgi:hypothetical protein